MSLVKTGEKAPVFTLKDDTDVMRNLSDFLGKWVLLYFYPKDDTPGCTKEACAIRDEFLDFETNNAVVFGVSTDSVKSHQKFKRKYHLPFQLLSDESKEVVRLYGVWGEKKFMGRTYEGTKRISFLIDPSGTIAKVYEKVKPEEHAGGVLRDIKNLSNQ